MNDYQCMLAKMQIRLLSEKSPAIVREYGGKIANLQHLMQKGVPVPDGICIPTQAYYDATRHLALDQILVGLCELSVERLRVIAEDMQRSIIETCDLSDYWATALEQHREEFFESQSRFAVRSSATLEDSITLSFPGRFKSYLFVDAKEITKFIKFCWASLWSVEAINYVCKHKLDVSKLSMAVLIQKQLDCQWSGVVFTSSPTQMGNDDILVEAAQGLGPGVVEGKARSTHQMIFSRSDLTKPASITYPTGEQYRVSPTQDSGILQSVKIDKAAEAPLSHFTILARYALDIEEIAGIPQDIEWAIDTNDDLWIVQSRPIPVFGLRTLEKSAVFAIEAGIETILPPVIKSHDKVALRLIASKKKLRIGLGWLIMISNGQVPEIPDKLKDVEQMSFVLIFPKLFDGQTLRRFSSKATRLSDLTNIVTFVHSKLKQFCIIAMEICPQEATGSARKLDNSVLIEVAYGSYVPKGIVPVSTFIIDSNGSVIEEELVFQEHGMAIEHGKPRQYLVQKTISLTGTTLKEIHQMVETISATRLNAVVEFGIMPTKEVFLIDITEDQTKLPDSRMIVSHGAITGKCRIVNSDDFQLTALDAHFHTDREMMSSNSSEKVIYVAENMFLTLEDLIISSSHGQVGFVFKHGSLLNHLAILLRELTIPAVIIKDHVVFDALKDGDIVCIETYNVESEILNIESQQG